MPMVTLIMITAAINLTLNSYFLFNSCFSFTLKVFNSKIRALNRSLTNRLRQEVTIMIPAVCLEIGDLKTAQHLFYFCFRLSLTLFEIFIIGNSISCLNDEN